MDTGIDIESLRKLVLLTHIKQVEEELGTFSDDEEESPELRDTEPEEDDGEEEEEEESKDDEKPSAGKKPIDSPIDINERLDDIQGKLDDLMAIMRSAGFRSPSDAGYKNLRQTAQKMFSGLTGSVSQTYNYAGTSYQIVKITKDNLLKRLHGKPVKIYGNLTRDE